MAQLQVLEQSIALIPELKPLVAQIARHDRDLADQIRRAASSTPLNIAEGQRRQGKDRLHSYRIAAGSAAEVRTALAVAQGWGYVEEGQAQIPDRRLDRILGMLWGLSR